MAMRDGVAHLGESRSFKSASPAGCGALCTDSVHPAGDASWAISARTLTAKRPSPSSATRRIDHGARQRHPWRLHVDVQTKSANIRRNGSPP